MKKLIGILVVIIAAVLMLFAFMEIGKRTAKEERAIVERSRGAVDSAKQSAEEMNKRTEQTNKELQKILGDGKK